VEYRFDAARERPETGCIDNSILKRFSTGYD